MPVLKISMSTLALLATSTLFEGYYEYVLLNAGILRVKLIGHLCCGTKQTMNGIL